MKLILASSSPRRREMMGSLGYEFTVDAADIDEDIKEDLTPQEIVMRLARQKAEKVHEKHPGDIVIGADTLVFLDGKALGKPADEKEAAQMLQALSGRRHEVCSGVAIKSEDCCDSFFVCTGVRFYELPPEMITRYIATGEPMDKAGAYGIQRYGALLVEKIDGDYFNVVGLPIAELARRLEKHGIRPKGF